MLSSDDPTYVIAPPFYWSVIEINIGIMAASIPSFKPLAKRYIPYLLGESYHKGGNSYSGSAKLRSPYKGSARAQRNKLNHQPDVEMSGPRKGSTACTFNTTASKVYHDGTHGANQEKDGVCVTVADRSGTQSVGTGSFNSQTSRHSHSSEEHIIKPGQGDIMRTVEITQTLHEVGDRKSAVTASQPDW